MKTRNGSPLVLYSRNVPSPDYAMVHSPLALNQSKAAKSIQ